ncbi:LysR family transcriptional regulator [Streptomyces tremellae]|uniref:LysR family transcriptional regulator n=1 Tax=Streptomyces tremellae TaxID=1124239 RepID=A0ABP7DQR8_9ACTN
MDRLSLMHSFATVARTGSFSGAARELNFSSSLVSRHVAELERQLGVTLLNRTARSVSLTEPGARYAEFAARVLGEIAAEEAGISELHDRAEGALSVVAPQWACDLGLGEAMAAFATRHPRIQVRFDLGEASGRTYGFLDSGYDVALHTRELRDSSVRLRKITALPSVLCASAGYLGLRGAPIRPDDLAGHDCLVHSDEPVWRLGREPGCPQHKVRGAVYCSNSYRALREAAVQGRGIALLPLRTAGEEVLSGSLLPLLTEAGTPECPLYAVYGPGAAVPRKVSVFLDFLTAWFRENPALPGADV